MRAGKILRTILLQRRSGHEREASCSLQAQLLRVAHVDDGRRRMAFRVAPPAAITLADRVTYDGRDLAIVAIDEVSRGETLLIDVTCEEQPA